MAGTITERANIYGRIPEYYFRQESRLFRASYSGTIVDWSTHLDIRLLHDITFNGAAIEYGTLRDIFITNQDQIYLNDVVAITINDFLTTDIYVIPIDVTLLGDQIMVRSEWFFDTTEDRDEWFSANPQWLAEGIYCVVGDLSDDGELYKYMLGQWVPMTAVVRGPSMVVYDTIGDNTDGAMTQKAVTEQLALKENKANKGVAGGYASLDETGKVVLSQIPDVVLGQMTHAGDFNAFSALANLTTAGKTILGTTDDTITLTNDAAPITGYIANQGNYYIATVKGTFATFNFEIGDWLLAHETGWAHLDNSAVVREVGTPVYDETTTTDGVRNINMTDVSSYADLDGRKISIRASVAGTTNSQMLSVNNMDGKFILFPDMDSSGLTSTPPADSWVREGGIYQVAYNGSQFVMSNFDVRAATKQGNTYVPGIVSVSDASDDFTRREINGWASTPYATANAFQSGGVAVLETLDYSVSTAETTHTIDLPEVSADINDFDNRVIYIKAADTYTPEMSNGTHTLKIQAQDTIQTMQMIIPGLESDGTASLSAGEFWEQWIAPGQIYSVRITFVNGQPKALVEGGNKEGVSTDSMRYVGTWNATTTYNTGDVVRTPAIGTDGGYNRALWMSLYDNNINKNPAPYPGSIRDLTSQNSQWLNINAISGRIYVDSTTRKSYIVRSNTGVADLSIYTQKNGCYIDTDGTIYDTRGRVASEANRVNSADIWNQIQDQQQIGALNFWISTTNESGTQEISLYSDIYDSLEVWYSFYDDTPTFYSPARAFVDVDSGTGRQRATINMPPNWTKVEASIWFHDNSEPNKLVGTLSAYKESTTLRMFYDVTRSS